MNPRMPISRRTFVATVSAASLALATEETIVAEAKNQSTQMGIAINVDMDFGEIVDYPLTKTKFAIFNSCIVPLATYERDAEFFSIARPESLRIDLGWGTDWAGWTEQPIAGTTDDPVLQLREMDAIARMLNDAGVLPYWSYCYTPAPLQDPPGDWRSVPKDMTEMARVLGLVARHYRNQRDTNPVGYHEVFNEPDNDDFTVGDMADYFAMYEHGSVALRENDPDGLVGGPALAFTYSWIDPFVDLVVARQLPLDFFSTHIYGTSDGFSSLDRMLDASRDSLDRYPGLNTVEIHLNEFNSYVIDYPLDGTQQKHRLAAAFLRDMAHLLARPEVTLVHWAQFLDSGSHNYSGMISIDGHRKALFNAAEIFARLPVDRVNLEMNASLDLGGMAGVEQHRAGLVIWNLAPGKKNVSLNLANLPFGSGTIREYRIDSEHSSWGDGTTIESLEQTQVTQHIPLADLVWSTTVGGGGVLYLEIDDDRGNSELASTPVGRWVRTHHYYPNRTTTAWADFDKRTWTFRLGSAEDAAADLEIGVTAEGLPEEMVVALELVGAPYSISPNSLLGLRVDYFDGQSYGHGVLFHGPAGSAGSAGDLFDQRRDAPMPWGTRRQPDQVVAVENLNECSLRLGDHAPAGWSGRVQLTVIMDSVGAGVRAKVELRSA